MTWAALVSSASVALGSATEARWVVEASGGVDAAELVRRRDEPVPAEVARAVAEAVRRRLTGEPLQHVLGSWSFRTLELAVDRRVLVPRPETEFVVEVALARLDGRADVLAVDLGTGSGAIALSLAAERPGCRVLAVERSPDALVVARANRARLAPEVAGRVELCQGDWYGALDDALAGSVDLVVANPPYLADGEWPGLDPVVRDYDPVEALVAGPTGLEALEAVVGPAARWLRPGGALVVELAPDQAAAGVRLAAAADLVSAVVLDDLAGRPRVLVAERVSA